MKLVKVAINQPKQDVFEWLEKNCGERNKLYWEDDSTYGFKSGMAVWFEYDKHATMFLLRWS